MCIICVHNDYKTSINIHFYVGHMLKIRLHSYNRLELGKKIMQRELFFFYFFLFLENRI